MFPGRNREKNFSEISGCTGGLPRKLRFSQELEDERGDWVPTGHSGENDYTELEKLLARKERKGGDQKLPEERYPAMSRL